MSSAKWTPIGVDSEGLYAFGYEFDEQAREKKQYGGYCMSESCIFEIRRNRSKSPNYQYMVFNDVRILKTTDKAETTCPDCGHALFWDAITTDSKPRKPTQRGHKGLRKPGK